MKNIITVHCLLLLSLVLCRFASFAQNSRATMADDPPTARNFGYPQSLFVDSQNGNIWVADFDNHRVLRFDVSSLTDIDEAVGARYPERYGLSQNYPNPFNPKTIIRFGLRSTESATVKVYDLLGREIATMFDGVAHAHELYFVPFDATAIPSGIYFYRLSSKERNEVRKMCVMK